MIRIIDDRSTGKTSRLMLLARENQAKFACMNPYAMQEKAKVYGITGIDFVSYDEALKIEQDRSTKFVIDELESFVRYAMTNTGNLVAYTLSVEK